LPEHERRPDAGPAEQRDHAAEQQPVAPQGAAGTLAREWSFLQSGHANWVSV
jgi:hypothetical protein